MDADGAALCLATDCEQWRTIWLVLGLHRGWSVALLTSALIAYSVLRGYLTLQVAPLREDEERAGMLPARADYARLFRVHRVVRVLFFVAVLSVVHHGLSWLTATVQLPAG